MKSLRKDTYTHFHKGYPYLDDNTNDIYLCTKDNAGSTKFDHSEFVGVILHSCNTEKIGQPVAFRAIDHLYNISEYHGTITIIN